MFVLSAEGPDQLDKGLWATHAILGVFPDRDAALAARPAPDDETMLLLTDMATRSAERV